MAPAQKISRRYPEDTQKISGRSPEDEDEDIFTIGEDGDIVNNENEESGVKRFSRESYKQIGASLRRYYLNIEKGDIITKPVIIDGKEYGAGELTERDLFKIYFKINIILWAKRYEEEFFNDAPETNVDIESEEERQIDDVEANIAANKNI